MTLHKDDVGEGFTAAATCIDDEPRFVLKFIRELDGVADLYVAIVSELWFEMAQGHLVLGIDFCVFDERVF